MLLRARKILEVLCFLIVCATTFLLWFVSLPRWGKYLCLLIGGVLPGLGAFGWSSRKRLEILRQIPNFNRICGIVFVVVWFVLDIAVEVISPESRWIMVNDGFSAGLGLVECLNAWIYLLYLFAPQKLRLQEQPEEE